MSSFEGKRILVVEDEPLVAMLVEEMLLDLGCEVVGPAYSIEHGTSLAEAGDLDAAVLDVNLNGELSHGIAKILRARGVPFAFATGYGSPPPMAEDTGAPILQKPYPADKLEAVLRVMLGV